MILPNGKLFMLLVVCIGEYVSGQEGVTNVTNELVNPAVDNGPSGGDVVEAVTENINDAVTNGNPEQAAPEGGPAGADVEGSGAGDAPGALQESEGTAGSTPSTKEVTGGSSDISTPLPTKIPPWTERVFAAKYMLTLGVVYIAICLFMAMKQGPLIVH